MFRVVGVDLPRNKRMEIALTYIYGIGKSTAEEILKKAGINPNKKTDVLSEDEVSELRKIIDQYLVEGESRKKKEMSVRRLIDIKSYRGIRHQKKLPVRGQRTHSNARTRKGRAIAIAGKKSVKTMK